jgi:hypothetical protein
MSLAASSAPNLWWPFIAMVIVGGGYALIEWLWKRASRRQR